MHPRHPPLALPPLQEELTAQQQQGVLLSTKLAKLQNAQVASAKALAAQQAQAAAAGAEQRTQLAQARKAAEVAMQEVTQMRLGCASHVQLLQAVQQERLAAAAAPADARLAAQQEAAAAELAIRVGVLQQELAETAAARDEERQQLLEQQAAAVAAEERQWAGLFGQLSGKLQQLAEQIATDPEQVSLSLEDALLAPAGPAQQAQHGLADQVSSDGSAQPVAATPPPAAMAEVHACLQQFYAAALELRSQFGGAWLQAAALQGLVDEQRQQLAEGQKLWQQRLEQELRQQEVGWDLKCSQKAAALGGEWRAKLAATEDRLQAELAQVTRTLATAQHNRQELEQQCSQLASELLAAQQQAAQALEAAAARAAAQQQQAQLEAAEAASHAAEQQARLQETLRQQMQAALGRQGEQAAAALQAAAAQHQQQLDEVRLLAEQAAQHHQQARTGPACKRWL
jgi:SWI/SNF-related matrix-associated actin-dependent regulator 1 of chromatin subfamily A